nr:hypothetical protein [Rhodomicrobium vannielii]
MIVQTEANGVERVVLRRRTGRGKRIVATENRNVSAEVQILIFGLERKLRGELVFDAATEDVAGGRVDILVDLVAIPRAARKAAIGEAARELRERVARRVANTAANLPTILRETNSGLTACVPDAATELRDGVASRSLQTKKATPKGAALVIPEEAEAYFRGS